MNSLVKKKNVAKKNTEINNKEEKVNVENTKSDKQANVENNDGTVSIIEIIYTFNKDVLLI